MICGLNNPRSAILATVYEEEEKKLERSNHLKIVCRILRETSPKKGKSP